MIQDLEDQITEVENATGNTCWYRIYNRQMRHKSDPSFIWKRVEIISTTHYVLDGKQDRLGSGNYGLTVEQIARENDQRYISHLSKRIAELQSYVVFQQVSLSKWEPKELTPIS